MWWIGGTIGGAFLAYGIATAVHANDLATVDITAGSAILAGIAAQIFGKMTEAIEEVAYRLKKHS